jgi:hypothetical protein
MESVNQLYAEMKPIEKKMFWAGVATLTPIALMLLFIGVSGLFTAICHFLMF